MTEIVLLKNPSGALVPADPQAAEYIAKIKLGSGVRAKVVKQNNVGFHRKLFALFNFAFDQWEPDSKTYKGEVVAKNFDQFRNDLTVLAGYYETTVTLRGDVRLVAKSLSFASMDHDEREALYSAVINVVLAKILKNYTREDLDAVVDRLMEFA